MGYNDRSFCHAIILHTIISSDFMIQSNHKIMLLYMLLILVCSPDVFQYEVCAFND